jgi:predicted RNA methylase
MKKLQESTKAGLLRLNALQGELDSRKTEMLIMEQEVNQIRNNECKAVIAHQLFQTPENIALEMVTRAYNAFKFYNNREPLNVLEPSAGLGRIVKAIKAKTNIKRIATVEQSKECASVLYGLDVSALSICDFMGYSTSEKFDLIIMNPPFTRGTDVKHINHARQFLNGGGVLVSLCYTGKYQEKLIASADYSRQLPEKSFKESGTGANVSLVMFFNTVNNIK